MAPLVRIVTPAPPGSTSGNRVTAERWARRLGELGCRVVVEEELGAADGELLIALHARRSHAAAARWAAERPAAPLVVALTGTDVYRDVPAGDAAARSSLALATRLVALQARAADALPAALRDKVRVIHQSCEVPPLPPPPPEARGGFVVAVLAHLRAIKDPLAAGEAVRLMPAGSPVRVLHAGEALEADLAERARALARDTGGRYRWLGPLDRPRALALARACRLLCLTSLAEGGANVVTEAIALGAPVVSTRIEGSLGLLGEDHPGYVAPGDRAALADLLDRCARDPALMDELRARSAALGHLADPSEERERWRALLAELGCPR